MSTKKQPVAAAEPDPKPAETTTSQAIEKATPAGALSTAFADLGADAEKYDNNFKQTDLATPFLQVLQSNSPETQEGNPEYIEGAKAGFIINTVSKEIYNTITAPGKEAKQPIYVLVAHYDKTVIKWKTREAGGGFLENLGEARGLQLLATCSKNEKGQMILPGTNGQHQLVETAQYYVTYTPNPVEVEPEAALIALTSTQLKKSRQLNSMIAGLKVERNGRKFTPPSFYQIFKLTTVYESNDKGNWYGVQFQPYKNVEELPEQFGTYLYEVARKLRESVSTGLVSADASMAAAANASAAPSEDIPF